MEAVAVVSERALGNGAHLTEREQNAAAAHCNVGNHVMAMQVIVDRLDQCTQIDAIAT